MWCTSPKNGEFAWPRIRGQISASHLPVVLPPNMAVDSKQIPVNPKKTGIHAWCNGRWLVCVGKNGMTGEADINVGSKLMAIEPERLNLHVSKRDAKSTAFVMCDLNGYDMRGTVVGLAGPGKNYPARLLFGVVVRGLAGDDDVVDVALAEACVGDTDEARVGL